MRSTTTACGWARLVEYNLPPVVTRWVNALVQSGMVTTGKPIFTVRERALLKAVERADDPATQRDLRKRLRIQRDTFRDRAERQRRESRGKQAPRASRPSASNANTTAKEAAFAKALATVEARLAAGSSPTPRRSAAEATPGSTTRSRTVAPGRDSEKATPSRRAGSGRSPKDPAFSPGKRRRGLPPGSTKGVKGGGQSPSVAHTRAKHGAIQAHGRRNQAKRDGR